ncbi:KIR protein [Plasmodium coatneyi]|uniref:KIR protein n=1 Tax=Plasmodium coatneyi TaxID=208452 RepID=A0A1B1E707_9APIC|nr:KIR protein [Plasmodium coatneyi]ANQ10549.1 KIR protein [Plasmodium coatneyi]
MPTTDGTLTEEELEEYLPSKRAYKELKEKEGKCSGGDDSIPEGMEGALREESGWKEYVKEFMKYWCYATQQGESTLSQDMRCGFLYYFTGDMIFSSLESDQLLQRTMNAICWKLKNLAGNDKFDIVCHPFNWNLFTFEKKVYDYYHDHVTMETEHESNKSPCNGALKDYVDAAKSAYDIMERQCKNIAPKNRAYCTKFSGKYSTHHPKELLKSKCGIMEEQESIAEITHRPSASFIEPKKGNTVPASTTSGGSVAASIIPSILGLIGLPTIALFLYKVKTITITVKTGKKKYKNII